MASKFKKIAVVNFSGNVGKSTLSRHLLAPMLENCAVVSVETINADSASDELIKGTQFGQLQEDMLAQESVVVDVGSSNIEEFLKLMRRYEGSHEDFDLYVVPCVPTPKQQKDTMSCILELAALGIPTEKIRIVFNQVPETDDPETVFSALMQFIEAEKKALANPAWTVYESELYSKIGGQSKSLAELADDPTDYKAQIAAEPSSEGKLALAGRLSVKRLSQGVRRNMLHVFASLTSA
jgi:MinD-like ATPase involved in chromosome partitioning or flagellar assembly